MRPWVICFLGGNFSGKSTQAPLLAETLQERLGISYEFLDTRKLIEMKIYPAGEADDVIIQLAHGKETSLARERAIIESGEANTTEWVADHVVVPEMIPHLRKDTWLFFPGSPRVQYEGLRFAQVLTDLEENDVIDGCLVIYVATPKDVCLDRARRWYSGITDPEERAKMAYKIENFDDRWSWYEADTKPTFEILESASGLYVPRITVTDNGTRSIREIQREVLHKASRAIGISI